MYLNALLKMLSCLGLYSMSYWYIDNATTATEISCSSIQPCSHHTSNLSSPHDCPQPKPLLWCYIIPNTHCLSVSYETLHAPYIELTSCSQTLVCVIITDTLWIHLWTTWLFAQFLLQWQALLTDSFSHFFCIKILIKSENYIQGNSTALLAIYMKYK